MNRIAIALLLTFATAFAAGKPDFSGTWKLDVGKSDFGPMPAPSAVTSTIKHAEPSLEIASTIVTAQGEASNESKYTTDGRENVNTDRGNTVKSTVAWDGDVLLINAKIEVGGAEISIDDRWSLSAGGKTITRKRHYTSPQGEVDVTWIYDKQ